MKEYFKKNREKGETLIEAILALAVVVAISTGIVAAVISALSGSTSNQNSDYALNLAQEGISTLKDMASTDYSNFSTYAGYYCMDDSDTLDNTKDGSNNLVNCLDNSTNISLSGSDIGSGNFLRKVYIDKNGISPPPASLVKCTSAAYIASIVTWSDSKCKSASAPNCHKVEIDSCVSNINLLPTP